MAKYSFCFSNFCFYRISFCPFYFCHSKFSSFAFAPSVSSFRQYIIFSLCRAKKNENGEILIFFCSNRVVVFILFLLLKRVKAKYQSLYDKSKMEKINVAKTNVTE